jgi:hypothetical protein
MKKYLTVFIVLTALIGITFGVYWYINKNQNQETRCQDGFRFVPSTQTCEPVEEENKTREIDFSKVKIKTIEGKELALVKEGETAKFTAQFKDEKNPSIVEYVSLDSSQAIKYSDDYTLVPYLYNSGGTGQFMYLGLFEIKTNTHLDSIVLGDRIAVGSIQITGDKAKVNFKDRMITESFAVTPSIPTQFVLDIRDKKIIPIMQLQNADYSDVEIKSPEPNTAITDTLIVKGAIPGPWYFEASAIFRILDSSYQEIALGNIQALSDWMTAQRVPFEISTSTANLNYTGNATLIIESENVEGGDEGARKVKRIYLPITIK